ncbi:MAG: efflux RND transporter periplasmic adaptor subunit [Deltaproteobacteria bacterium]|nr:efflux RND transporter periplasmic adaptor subunit [Deltaproteobacteria bacterium]
MNLSRPRLVALIAVILVITLFFTFRISKPRVDAVLPKRGTAVQAVYATGSVEATVMLPIAARTGARLIELHVDEGSEVEKGQVLARLEDEDLRQSLAELKAKEEFARKDLERKEALSKQRAVSREEYELARSNLKAAEAAVAAAEAQVSYLTLIAPEKGRIIRRDGEIGQQIPANQAIFWFTCCQPLRISTEVDEEDIALVKPGQRVLISSDAFPGKVFNGVVQAITPKGDPVARSYRVRVGFTEETPLLIGMTAETNIVVRESENALLIPSQSVWQGKVKVVESGAIAVRQVEVGARGPEETEIIKGLSEEDEVVLNPSEAPEAGTSVRTRIVRP